MGADIRALNRKYVSCPLAINRKQAHLPWNLTMQIYQQEERKACGRAIFLPTYPLGHPRGWSYPSMQTCF